MPSKYNSIFGWFDFEDIYSDMTDRFDNCLFVEIGSFQGRSACYLAESIKEKKKNISLVCVDLFPTQKELNDFQSVGAGQGEECGIIERLDDSLLNVFVRNINGAGVSDIVIPVKASSHKAAKLFQNGQLKFIFIDAGHGYDAVKADLELWFPLLASDGVIAGHDWQSPGVNNAVKDFFGNMGITVESKRSSWIVDKKMA